MERYKIVHELAEHNTWSNSKTDKALDSSNHGQRLSEQKHWIGLAGQDMP